MIKKSLLGVLILSVLSACANKPVVAHKNGAHKNAWSWSKFIKSNKSAVDKRHPASVSSIPGLKEFLVALKASPNFFKDPVGSLLVTEYSGTSDGQAWTDLNSTAFLKQNRYGSFSLSGGQDEDHPLEFVLDDNSRYEDAEMDITNQSSGTKFEKFVKISPTKFKAYFSINDGQKVSCVMDLDLSKSAKFLENICKDATGKLTSESKIKSVTPINVKSYADKLKEIKLTINSNALECDDLEDEDSTCKTSVEDGENNDWSYLVK